jgi:hypothetical protein
VSANLSGRRNRDDRHHHVIVNIAQDRSHAPPMALFLPEAMFDAHNERERTEAVTGRKVGRSCSASSAWRFEQAGDLSDGFGAWADVPHRGARVPVPGLGHDQLQRDTLLAEVSRCEVRSWCNSHPVCRVNKIRARS